MKQLTGTYRLPQFKVEITNPQLDVTSKRVTFADNETEVEFTLSITGAKFGSSISANNAQGIGATQAQLETWIENKLQTYKL